MTDTPSIREVLETSQEVETPVVEEKVEAKVETETPEAPVAEEQPVEKFAEDKDLTGLTPEQLLETKKQWEAAYTRKRQAETAELKRLKAELEQFKAQQVATPQVEKVDFRQQKAEINELYRLGQIDYNSAIAKLEEITREEARQVAREEIEQVQSQTKQQEEDSRQQQLLSDFYSTDLRLNQESPTHDSTLELEVRSKIGEALESYIQENGTSAGFDVKGLTNQFVQEYDQRIDELVKIRTQQSVQAAKMRDAKIQKGASRGTTTQSTPVQGDSIRDVLSQTLDELG